jgi:hypothetical protein
MGFRALTGALHGISKGRDNLVRATHQDNMTGGIVECTDFGARQVSSRLRASKPVKQFETHQIALLGDCRCTGKVIVGHMGVAIHGRALNGVLLGQNGVVQVVPLLLRLQVLDKANLLLRKSIIRCGDTIPGWSSGHS